MALPPTDPVPFRPSPERLRQQIRQLAAETKNIAWSAHALERMEERDISRTEALRVLRTGDIDGLIVPGKGSGEWKCKVVAGRRGARDIGVVTLVLARGRLLIKTVEYEDL